eukprot:scaffold63519_cov20-Prasinocladus_malaysianus.AAC.1
MINVVCTWLSYYHKAGQAESCPITRAWPCTSAQGGICSPCWGRVKSYRVCRNVGASPRGQFLSGGLDVQFGVSNFGAFGFSSRGKVRCCRL